MAPLYFLHIPKTGGSSLTRLLEDSFAAAELWPVRQTVDLAVSLRADTRPRLAYAGHHGVSLPGLASAEMSVITVLRDPAERLWSEYRASRDYVMQQAPDGDYPFEAHRRHFGRFHALRSPQARWLTDPPQAAQLPNDVIYRFAGAGPPDVELEAAAMRALRTLSLVGPTERLDDFVSALSRLLGRWLAPPPRINVGFDRGPIPPEIRELSAAWNPVDRRLHAECNAMLDRALDTLPPLPPEPEALLPFEQTMDAAFAGTGWHTRLHTPEVGWHRWSGPGTISTIRLPVRFSGHVTIELNVVSAVSDDVVEGLRLSVQGRPVRHVLESCQVGCAAVANAVFEPADPAVIQLELPRTAPLRELDGSESDPAGIALGTIEVKSRSAAGSCADL